MVYLSADNNLSEECVWSLKEIFRAPHNAQIGVVVQIDPRAKSIRRFDVSAFHKRNTGAAGHRVKAAALPEGGLSDGRLLGRAMKTRDNTDDMASVKTLIEFIEKCKGLHPAKQYLLVLSGHGSGSIGRALLADEFSSRGSGVHALTLPGLRNALMATNGVDIVGFDACGMGMAEVGHQIREHAKFLVASEGFEQNTGWPYFEILSKLNETPTMSPKDLAAAIVDTHTTYYSDFLMAGVSTDIAACNLSLSGELASRVKRLVDRCLDKLPTFRDRPTNEKLPRDKRTYLEDLPLTRRGVADAVILAHWRAQSYRFEQHTDLYDFCDLLEKGVNDAEVRDACKAIKDLITGPVPKNKSFGSYIVKSGRTGGTFQYSNGLAIYFPWSEFDEEYNKLSFASAASWGPFLERYVRKTRRRPRDGDGERHTVAIFDDDPSVVRDNPHLGVKDNPHLGTKDNPHLGTKEQKLLAARMKNPPDIFFEASE